MRRLGARLCTHCLLLERAIAARRSLSYLSLGLRECAHGGVELRLQHRDFAPAPLERRPQLVRDAMQRELSLSCESRVLLGRLVSLRERAGVRLDPLGDLLL